MPVRSLSLRNWTIIKVASSTMILVTDTRSTKSQSSAMVKKTESSSGMCVTLGVHTGARTVSSELCAASITSLLSRAATGARLLIPGLRVKCIQPLMKSKMTPRMTRPCMTSLNQSSLPPTITSFKSTKAAAFQKLASQMDLC